MPNFKGYSDDRPAAKAPGNKGMSVPGAKGFSRVGSIPWKGVKPLPKAKANMGGKGKK